MSDGACAEQARAASPRAGQREWAGLAVLMLPTVLLALDLSVLHLTAPQLGADLRPSRAQLLWIIDIYGFMIAGFLVTMGTLGDRIGRRRLLLVGAAGFGVASLLAAYAGSAETLIVARALLGVAGATLMPSTLALIGSMFTDARQRAFAIGVWATCFALGLAIGPLVGGLLLHWFWWGSVFLLAVPVMLLLLATAPVLLPEARNPAAGRVDLVSVALSLLTILPVVYGIKLVARQELAAWPAVLAALAVAGFSGWWFVRRQRRLAHPLLDLTLFRRREFVAALATLLVGLGAIGGTYLLFAQYLQLVAGMSPLHAGLWMMPSALAMVAASLLAPVIARRVPPHRVVGAGLCVSVLGFALLSLVGAGSGLPMLVAGAVIAAAGVGPTMVLSTDLVVSTAPRSRTGSAAAVAQTSTELGVALGIALLGSLAAAVYRLQLPAAAVAGLPARPANAARDDLVGALAAARGLPPAEALHLIEQAREAFTAGLNVVAAGCAVVVTLLLLLRRSWS